jgi:hypothetical protein
MSVEVVVFASVEELVAITVAPGIGVLPDFTMPVIEKLEGAEGAEGASCPDALIATSSRRTTGRMAIPHVFEPEDSGTPHLESAQHVMPGSSCKFREPSIHSTLRRPLIG